MKDLQDRLAELEREKDKTQGMSGVLSTLSENFKDPAVLMGILSSVGGLFKGKQDVMPMNGINDEVADNIDARKQKMVKAVNTLMRLDPSFPENISALAVLCENKPEMYKLAVNYLNNI
jgi:hypothetical protein